MKRSLRPTTALSKLNAWNGVVRARSLSNDCGFCAQPLHFGYQPESIQTKAHSEGWDG
ncbi:hypothetical protein KTD31_02545 [Burkholderia multivorans]|uniref:hypothetical protein n=1 Tax=Burkholderia multivorans TaxID=87883 RepID=UPI001C220DE8|nr:hypothetical protein [Burkholderia multivorans]MBU9200285.1 hypothetical protein [Burkholderia multivorans]MDN8078589.1 hypothetical protein [Burkholderia multivorans]